MYHMFRIIFGLILVTHLGGVKRPQYEYGQTAGPGASLFDLGANCPCAELDCASRLDIDDAAVVVSDLRFGDVCPGSFMRGDQGESRFWTSNGISKPSR